MRKLSKCKIHGSRCSTLGVYCGKCASARCIVASIVPGTAIGTIALSSRWREVSKKSVVSKK